MRLLWRTRAATRGAFFLLADIALLLLQLVGVAAQSDEIRSYNGTGNNVDNPLWGSTNIYQASSYIPSIRIIDNFRTRACVLH